VNWEAVDPETKEKWEQARAIVSADDSGSWGGNFFKHSEEIQKFFPELRNARETYETQFQNLLRLTRFGLKKAKESGSEKNIKMLAFGHENYTGYAINQYFGDNDIKNCETISISTGKEGLLIERRGEKRSIDEL
jgi:hypothetical protein